MIVLWSEPRDHPSRALSHRRCYASAAVDLKSQASKPSARRAGHKGGPGRRDVVRNGLWSALQTHLQGVDGATLPVEPVMIILHATLLSLECTAQASIAHAGMQPKRRCLPDAPLAGQVPSPDQNGGKKDGETWHDPGMVVHPSRTEPVCPVPQGRIR
ncbi:hypothetical protein CN177_14595 [Sinorhizobium meliloti]|nr:hypothetical protein CN219_21265 [Sinorhizobium meliloti]RVI38427.1 hypothetical protein CN197_04720 [Sinorhizobium meliloti]RVI42175.1 hypothetical protein CN196_22925 [Sinorhizobium meliloti]RVJ25016.1 hypothetical protein CN177_14595 [Sinorhizobium meliloti]RVJ99403.1 hypothetical protein CN170_16165 [Sinorhizobium meliloti]